MHISKEARRKLLETIDEMLQENLLPETFVAVCHSYLMVEEWLLNQEARQQFPNEEWPDPDKQVSAIWGQVLRAMSNEAKPEEIELDSYAIVELVNQRIGKYRTPENENQLKIAVLRRAVQHSEP